jgi:cupin fold WbuC family metalloprotein
MDELKIVTAADRARMSAEAAASARGRTHLLLHEDHSDQVQRLLVALGERTYLCPHRHPDQWEILVALQGAARVLVFDDDGTVVRTIVLASAAASVVELPAGCWHSLSPLEPGTLFLEAKPGPFRPAEFAAWAPPENEPGAGRMMEWLSTAAPGDSPSTA